MHLTESSGFSKLQPLAVYLVLAQRQSSPALAPEIVVYPFSIYHQPWWRKKPNHQEFLA
jgi:hypothetical protein